MVLKLLVATTRICTAAIGQPDATSSAEGVADLAKAEGSKEMVAPSSVATTPPKNISHA